MKWRSTWFALLLVSSPLFAQQIPPMASFPPPPVVGPTEMVTYSPTGGTTFADDGEDGMLRSNRNFPNFIGFMSNPLQNIDPRSLTQIWPMFGSTWATASPPIPDTSFQVLGPGVNIALTDRLSVGMNQGDTPLPTSPPRIRPNL